MILRQETQTYWQPLTPTSAFLSHSDDITILIAFMTSNYLSSCSEASSISFLICVKQVPRITSERKKGRLNIYCPACPLMSGEKLLRSSYDDKEIEALK